MSDEVKAMGVVFVGSILFLIALWIGQSYLEAQAFNRVTGKNVSTWDALFIELRVQESTK